jgi:hypothetical protein
MDSVIWLPIFITGFSDVIGSWKIIAISGPPEVPELVGGQLADLLALVAHAALADDVAARQEPHDRPRQDRLAEPDSPDDADRLATLEGERHPVDGSHEAGWGLEVRLEVGDLEDRALVRVVHRTTGMLKARTP